MLGALCCWLRVRGIISGSFGGVSEHENVVLTTFYPTAYFARRISGGLVPVDCPVPEGEDPIFWQPGREALERYRNAKLIVINGAQFEKWAIHASLPSSRIVNSAGAFKSEFIRYDTGITHSHGAAGEHSHEGIDGHTARPDPRDHAGRGDRRGHERGPPEHADAFATNLTELARDLTELDNAFKAMTPKLEGVKLLASHPRTTTSPTGTAGRSPTSTLTRTRACRPRRWKRSQPRSGTTRADDPALGI